MKNKILTYSLNQHKSLFSTTDKNDYFYIQTSEHPYISEPYRAESYAVEFLRKGSIIMQTQLEKKIIHAPAVIALGPTVTRSFTKNSSEILIDIIFFKPQFFLETQTNVFFLSKYEFFENNNVLELKGKQKIKFERIFNLISELLRGNSKHQSDTLISYLYILIYELDSVLDTIPVDVSQNPIFQNFKILLFKDFLKQRSVEYYADSLNVTRKYLSEVIKKNSGKTASEWITEVVIQEAKVLLQNKSLTINQISDELNFQNQSAFGRFFKNHTGISPLEYRK
ncbi:helix-turn-helix domain-containing protein [Flavobacterium ginsengiterrae]|uniref:AraC family transcriptional regulator n=1 Tax=Flavobacterium ginsengiterrae TaxID=871695 RepID=A0ABP7GJU0_9FLAO